MLEQKTRLLYGATLKDQARLYERHSRGFELWPVLRSRCSQQFERKLPADRGADLRYLLCIRAEPLEAGKERSMQGRRYRYRSSGSVGSLFQDHLRQLFEKQRNPVTALDDRVCDIVRQPSPCTNQPLHQNCRVAPIESGQRYRSDRRLTGPGGSELGSKRGDQ